MMSDLVVKKNATFFITRLRGAILRECKNGFSNRCTYPELMLALTQLKAVPQDRKALKNLFIEHNGYLSISNLIASIEFLSTHVSGFAMLKFDIEEINRLETEKPSQQYQQQDDRAVTLPAEDFVNDSASYYNLPVQQQHSFHLSSDPSRTRTMPQSKRHSLLINNQELFVNQKIAPKQVSSQPLTPLVGANSTVNNNNNNNNNNIKDNTQMMRDTLLSQFPKTTTCKVNRDEKINSEHNFGEFTSTFKVNTQNPDEFKGIRLPRPKNVRNELNLRKIGDMSNFQSTGMTQASLNNSTAIGMTTVGGIGVQNDNEAAAAAALAASEQEMKGIVDRIKANNVGYHHLQGMEKIFGEIDLNNSGFAEKDRFHVLVKKRMGKVIKDDMLGEIIESILDGESRNYIEATRLSRLLDLFKFGPRLMVLGERNNSDNYKKKMLDDKDISVDKLSNAHELYIMLIEKLEEKFEKFQRAFFFFDPEQGGRVYYTQFKQTLDKLCLRFRDEEAKELFHFLDKKQDGYLDYQELCSLVPNRLEIEMLDRNGESLADRTRQIYERFGDLKNYSQDPHRVYERARYHSNSLHDATTDMIGRDIFYSDKLKKAIKTNIILRTGRSAPGDSLKFGYNIPSDIDQTHAYGLKPKHGENMYDILNNNYAKEWTVDLEEKRRSQSVFNNLKLKKKSKNTFANMMRQLHNTTCLRDNEKQTRNNFSHSSTFSSKMNTYSDGAVGKFNSGGTTYTPNNSSSMSKKQPKNRSNSFQSGLLVKVHPTAAQEYSEHQNEKNGIGSVSVQRSPRELSYSTEKQPKDQRQSFHRTYTCF